MSKEAPSATKDPNGKPDKKSRLWLWFLAGFLIVLIGFLILAPMYSYDGLGVQRVTLWKYYYLEILRGADSTGHLGPTSQNASEAMMVALQHIVISIAGGVVFSGIGWFAKRRSRLHSS